jgi:hypothetical protein
MEVDGNKRVLFQGKRLPKSLAHLEKYKTKVTKKEDNERVLIKIKTRKELGCTKKGSIPGGWSTQMSYLFGRKIKAEFYRALFHVKDKNNPNITWCLLPREVTVLRELEGGR